MTEAELRRALGEKPGLPAAAEARLFERADALLAARRARVAGSGGARAAAGARAGEALRRAGRALSGAAARALELAALRPDAPAAAAAAAVLALAFVALHGGGARPGARLEAAAGAEPAAYSRYNDAGSRYDAERLADRRAYEREVEDDRRQPSEGL